MSLMGRVAARPSNSPATSVAMRSLDALVIRLIFITVDGLWFRRPCVRTEALRTFVDKELDTIVGRLRLPPVLRR